MAAETERERERINIHTLPTHCIKWKNMLFHDRSYFRNVTALLVNSNATEH